MSKEGEAAAPPAYQAGERRGCSGAGLSKSGTADCAQSLAAPSCVCVCVCMCVQGRACAITHLSPRPSFSAISGASASSCGPSSSLHTLPMMKWQASLHGSGGRAGGGSTRRQAGR